jgi:branched-chain amino acid transport system substrate-binding protein
VLQAVAFGRCGKGTRKRVMFRAAAVLAMTAGVMTAGVMTAGAGAASASVRVSAPATGSPVTIGLISDGGGSSSIGTAALVEQGAQAAVKYVNANGGLDGHKVTLFVCENQSTPAGGQSCANNMVQKGVVAVVEPFTGQGQTEVPTIVGAGIPYITISGASTPELTSTDAYAIEGGFPAYLGAIALSAKQHGYKKVAFLVENVPAAIQGAQVLGGLVFKAAGVGLDVIPVNPGTADVSPQLQSAVSAGANAVGNVGDVTLCSSFLKAYATLDLNLPRYVLSTCQDPSIEKSATLDKVLAGSYITTTTKTSKADNAEYAAIVHKFMPKVNPSANVSSNQASGVVPVLTLANAMKGSTQPVTAAGINQTLTTAKNVAIPLSGGLTFTCNGKAIPLLKSVCSSAAAIGTIKAGKAGTVTNIKVYNPTPLF